MHKKTRHRTREAWRNRSFLRNVISPLRVAVVIDKIHRHGMTVERKLLRSIISSSEKEWPTPEYSRKSWAEFIVFNRSPVIFAHSIRISGSLVPWHWRIGVDLLDLHRPGRKGMSIWGRKRASESSKENCRYEGCICPIECNLRTEILFPWL